MENKILFVVAHPDDEVLGCGGTVAKMVAEGSSVSCLFMGCGKSSRYDKKNQTKIEEEQTVLKKEVSEAAKILGINKIFFEDFPDQKYDTVPFLDLVKSVEKVKNAIKPDVIFTHYSGDLNLDHQLTSRAVLTATRPISGESVKSIYFFETPSSTEWGLHQSGNCFSPNVFVDISPVFDKKIRALSAYKSESREYPHPRSSENIEVVAKRWGAVVGKEKVEAFILVRKIQ